MEFLGINLSAVYWGVRLWIWLYLLLSILLVGVVALYWYRETIRRTYYQIRFPEKLLKVIIHYKNNYFKEYYRLIPDDKMFILESKSYQFDDKNILKDNDFFVRKKEARLIAKIDGKEYNINNKLKLIKKWRSYAEIHYYFNVPTPIDFDMSKKALAFSSKQLQDFKDNDLFAKLLTLDTEKNFLFFILVVSILSLIVSGINLAKTMGWLK